MKKSKKLMFTGIIGGLTSIACTGCVWQYQRYFQSIDRWAVIEDQIENFKPIEIESQVPWDYNTIKDWRYHLVSIKGEFVGDKQVSVMRMADSRIGYMVVRPFMEENQKFTILVNCGWVPQELKNFVELSDSLKKGEIIGLVKMDESEEIKRTGKMYPKLDELFNLIDLDQISEHLEVDVSGSHSGFIDLIRDESKEKEVEVELYPVVPTNRDFSKPYLTPRKHAEYSTFWGCSALIGFLSIIKVLKF